MLRVEGGYAFGVPPLISHVYHLLCHGLPRMQSFYQAESQVTLPAGSQVELSDVVSVTPRAAPHAPREASSWYGSFGARAPRAPPIFTSTGRNGEAVAADRRIRDVQSFKELLRVIQEGLAKFDEGTLVIALCTGAKLVDERSLSSISSHAAWVTLVERVHGAIPCLEPRGLSMAAYACAKLALNKDALLSELADCSVRKAADFSSTDVAKICWAFAKLDFVQEALAFWKEMAQVVLHKVGTARHVELSMIAWAFGTAQQGTSAMYAELGACTLRMLQDLTPQCLANIAVAFARQNLPDRELFEAISRRSRSLVAEFADFDVTNLCWAQARANQVDPDLFEQLATHTVCSRFVKRYSAEMVAQMCWAFAVAKVQHSPLFCELSDFIAKHASVFEVQYVANCAWAYATLGVPEASAWQALARECKGGRLWRYTQDQLSAVCWAFTRIRWQDAELFQDMLQVASQRLAEFDTQSLLNFLSAVVVLREEDWFSVGEDELREDPKEILDSLLDSVMLQLQENQMQPEE
ncbi:unnamed protein product, partial [Durusdinium trenchii]